MLSSFALALLLNAAQPTIVPVQYYCDWACQRQQAWEHDRWERERFVREERLRRMEAERFRQERRTEHERREYERRFERY